MMTTDEPASHRLDLLEARIMYQERAIEDLNETITAQWRLADSLARRVAQLEERLLDLGAAAREAPEPPPPHY